MQEVLPEPFPAEGHRVPAAHEHLAHLVEVLVHERLVVLEAHPEAQSLGALHVVADQNVTPGGCRLETEFGSLDQQLEAQLARITEELLS